MRERLKNLGHDLGELYLHKHKYVANYNFSYYKCKRCGFMFNENSLDDRIIMIFNNILKDHRIDHRAYDWGDFMTLLPLTCDELIIKDIIE